MSDQARNSILERLRSQAPATRIPESDFSVVSDKQWTPAERIHRLRERLESVNGEVHECGHADWVSNLCQLLSGRDLGTLLYASGTSLGDELEKAWDSSATLLPSLVSTQEGETEFRERVFNVDASITSTLGGIAETGTLMLWPNPAEPRLMSLAPALHIALLDASDIYNSFWEAMTQMNWSEKMPTNALLISGPSKTADIEQQLSYGVHGPRELIVLIRS